MTKPAADKPGDGERIQSLGDLYRRARDRLRAGKIPSADLDARLLVAFALQCKPDDIVLRQDDTISPEATQRVDALVRDRLAGVSIGRITGRREFWGFDFLLSEETLEPRVDTETLIEQILAWCPDRDRPWRFADIGSGTGAIAVSLLTELPVSVAAASDLSFDALQTTRRNAQRHGVADRLLIHRGDFASAIADGFDFLVSNPPYIRSEDIAGLDVEVRLHDPHLALDGGASGLDAYRTIICESVRALKPAGMIFLEIGWDQAQEVAELLQSHAFENVNVSQDLGGRDRVIAARRANEKSQWRCK